MTNIHSKLTYTSVSTDVLSAIDSDLFNRNRMPSNIFEALCYGLYNAKIKFNKTEAEQQDAIRFVHHISDIISDNKQVDLAIDVVNQYISALVTHLANNLTL